MNNQRVGRGLGVGSKVRLSYKTYDTWFKQINTLGFISWDSCTEDRNLLREDKTKRRVKWQHYHSIGDQISMNSLPTIYSWDQIKQITNPLLAGYIGHNIG
ncbi:hypothetical protein BDB01DRAFT_832633 [Pilobolus umbonatus]|nr:hypothetical protein BDB01DRAFT_832633 [Pilobolus umbonatus]